MNPDTIVSCPSCGHEFKPTDRSWLVCLDCGQILPPGEHDNHKPDDCIRKLGTYMRRYTQEEAEERQERWIKRRRR